VKLSPFGTSATNWPIVPAPNDRWWAWSSWWNENWQGKPKYLDKTCPNATSFTTNPTWSNLGCHGGKLATNHGLLTYETCIHICMSIPIYLHKLPIETKSSASLTFSTNSYYVFGHYPSSCLYLKHCPIYFSKHNVLETRFCLHFQVKPTQFGQIDRASPYLLKVKPTQLGPIDRASPYLRTPMPASRRGT
jgi:hypothetical protein